MTEYTGADIRRRIMSLKHEQERIQKKTFTNWMNSYLKQKCIQVNNVFDDIKKGLCLLSLLEVLSGEKLNKERGVSRVQCCSNIATALNFMEQKKIRLVNINVSDIADGKPSIVLGLIWAIILYFQIEETFEKADTDTNYSGAQVQLSASQRGRISTKNALLSWINNTITKKYGITISNFENDWRDGLAFIAIVHTINPDLVDVDQCRKQGARTNLEKAFSVAEAQLKIPRLLDPEDVDVEKPDEKSIMTYLSQFLKAYPQTGEDPNLSTTKNTSELELADYNDLLAWWKEAYEVLQIVDRPVTDRQEEYMEYWVFKREFDRRQILFERLEDIVANNKSFKITSEIWQEFEPKWKYIVERTRMWLWKLDASLPSRLGKFGDWLNQAEEMLDVETPKNEDSIYVAEHIFKLINEHKDFFKNMEPYSEFFLPVERAGNYEGEFIPPYQITNLKNRLHVVCKEAPKKETMLEYDEQRHRLLGFSSDIEKTLKLWVHKIGTQKEVEVMILYYQKNNLVASYTTLQYETRRRYDALRTLLGHDETDQIQQFAADETTQRCEMISAEIQRLQPILENGLEYWKRYTASFQTLLDWITKWTPLMCESKEQIKELFSEVPQFEEKQKILNECADFLIANCRKSVAAELRDDLHMLNTKYVEFVDYINRFKHLDYIEQTTKECQAGVDRISQWLKNADALLLLEVPCKHEILKEYLQDINQCGNQVEEVENDFKVTTKTAQSLVKNSEQALVNEMLQTLNDMKDVLMRLHGEIPDRIKYLKEMLLNIEPLETRILELNIWLDKGETLLATHKLDSNQHKTTERLEKHKQFFSEMTNLHSLVIYHNKVSSTKPKLPNVNFDVIDVPMEESTKRFQTCISSAKDWEQKLENLSSSWRVLSRKEHALVSWFQNDSKKPNVDNNDKGSSMRKDSLVFSNTNKQLIEDYLKAGQDILMLLDDAEKMELQQEMASVQDIWKNGETKFCGQCDMVKVKEQGDIWPFCSKCGEGLRQNSSPEHPINRSFSDVTMVEDVATNVESVKSSDDLCDKHAGEIISLYCVCHGQLCCSACVDAEHRQCADIVNIEDIAKSVTQSVALEDLQSSAEEINGICDIILKEKITNINILEKQAKTLEMEILRRKKIIIGHLDIAELSANEEINNKKESCIRKIMEEANHIKKIKSDLNSQQHDLQALKVSGSDKRLFIGLKRLDVMQNNLEQELQKSREVLLKKYELKLPSPVSTTKAFVSFFGESILESKVIEGIPQLKKLQQCQFLSPNDGLLTLVETINPNEISRYVWKLCYFELHDKVALNSTKTQIYVVDIQSKRMETIDLLTLGNPWYIDKYDDNHVLVAIIGQTSLFKINVLSLNIVGKIESEWQYTDFSDVICFNDHIVIHDYQDKNFVILKEDRVLLKIPCATKKKFGYLCGREGNTIIYSNCHENTVACVTLEGQQVFRITSITKPMGIAVDKNNFIYVGTEGNGIQKIKPDGTVTSVLPYAGLIRGMTYKKSTHELIIMADEGLQFYKIS